MGRSAARQGNGNAFHVVALLLCVTFFVDHAAAKTVKVGGNPGWILGAKFPKLAIMTKDQLLFQYPAEAHDVVEVTASNYKSCNAKGGRTRSSGYDQLSLSAGTHFFICGVADHCKKGMKFGARRTVALLGGL
ncbi:hypothetical protein R1flu_006945 [Riccia fluitans]|uniref:Phytocyanin domain-containing protein n=1 Tax=Riccia fluitans TaxID=41844 RepID=A0ABD1YY14_9MARC